MEEKIKILSVGHKKIKKEESQNWDRLLERYAPGVYETINAVGEKEAINQTVLFAPKIIMISEKIKDPMGLLKKIKSILPNATVFIMLSIADDDEIIHDYIANGAYKCYTIPLVMDTLMHDMYVSLNMEEI